ncbi:MAG: hypothetical protein MJA30_34280 [Cytophagales bacterium]|nr:hypothetical protein [Cytophagales bacterium]
MTKENTAWTWAEQVSTYRFWGLFLFFLCFFTIQVLIGHSVMFLGGYADMDTQQVSVLMALLSFFGFAGIWLAWFAVRLKNHYLLFLYGGITCLGLLLGLLVPSATLLIFAGALIGLGIGAIWLSIPSIIAGGRGGGEMFVVSYGLVIFFERMIPYSTLPLFAGFLDNGENFFILSLVLAFVGMAFLLPVKPSLFYVPPPEKKVGNHFVPTYRPPWKVALLCLIPIYNIYYTVYLSYRFHGEVNAIYPSRTTLSPKAAAWCTLLLGIILLPMITGSLNSSLVSKITSLGKSSYHKTWVVIACSFFIVPVSFALLQTNLNKCIQASPS